MTKPAISRRNFLKGSAVFAASIPLASLLASCSGGSGAADATTQDEPSEPDRETVGEDPEGQSSAAGSGSILVAYYSATGHTQNVAELIAEATGADTFVVTPADPYTDDDLNWRDESSRVTVEHEDPEGRHVELETVTPDGFDSYDTVFVGYPIWWGGASWVMDDFASGNDFSGKTVVPFCTSSSSGVGESATDLAALAGTGDWLEGERFSGSASASDVRSWLDGLGLDL